MSRPPPNAAFPPTAPAFWASPPSMLTFWNVTVTAAPFAPTIWKSRSFQPGPPAMIVFDAPLADQRERLAWHAARRVLDEEVAGRRVGEGVRAGREGDGVGGVAVGVGRENGGAEALGGSVHRRRQRAEQGRGEPALQLLEPGPDRCLAGGRGRTEEAFTGRHATSRWEGDRSDKPTASRFEPHIAPILRGGKFPFVRRRNAGAALARAHKPEAQAKGWTWSFARASGLCALARSLHGRAANRSANRVRSSSSGRPTACRSAGGPG